jgi:hypothetical protein
MPYPVLPEDFAGKANLLQRIGDVIQGPWGKQPIEQGVPIVPGTGQPGGMSPPPPGVPRPDSLSPLMKPGMPGYNPATDQPRGTPLSRMMKEEPMWTKWAQEMKLPVDRLLQAVPALRENWQLSDSDIKHYFALLKQRGEI